MAFCDKMHASSAAAPVALKVGGGSGGVGFWLIAETDRRMEGRADGRAGHLKRAAHFKVNFITAVPGIGKGEIALAAFMN